jgi:hypothetical protein
MTTVLLAIVLSLAENPPATAISTTGVRGVKVDTSNEAQTVMAIDPERGGARWLPRYGATVEHAIKPCRNGRKSSVRAASIYPRPLPYTLVSRLAVASPEIELALQELELVDR